MFEKIKIVLPVRERLRIGSIFRTGGLTALCRRTTAEKRICQHIFFSTVFYSIRAVTTIQADEAAEAADFLKKMIIKKTKEKERERKIMISISALLKGIFGM